jgi:hypothetical protein
VSLKNITLKAVEQLKVALGDLAIDLIVRKREADEYVPGTPQGYTTTDHNCKGVITKYRYDEIDGTLIQAQDVLIILFPISSAIPKQNDIVVNGTQLYRVMNNNPMYAGSEIAFNLVQGRPA